MIVWTAMSWRRPPSPSGRRWGSPPTDNNKSMETNETWCQEIFALWRNDKTALVISSQMSVKSFNSKLALYTCFFLCIYSLNPSPNHNPAPNLKSSVSRRPGNNHPNKSCTFISCSPVWSKAHENMSTTCPLAATRAAKPWIDIQNDID